MKTVLIVLLTLIASLSFVKASFANSYVNYDGKNTIIFNQYGDNSTSCGGTFFIGINDHSAGHIIWSTETSALPYSLNLSTISLTPNTAYSAFVRCAAIGTQIDFTYSIAALPAQAASSYNNSDIATIADGYVKKDTSGKPINGAGAPSGSKACEDARNKFQYTGDSGGQCRAFVNCIVILASSGNQKLGGDRSDYFAGFTNAGGKAVMNVSELVPGDIVQDGQGVHTFIISAVKSYNAKSNTADAIVIDSNHYAAPYANPAYPETVSEYERPFTLDNNNRAFRMGNIGTSSSNSQASDAQNLQNTNAGGKSQRRSASNIAANQSSGKPQKSNLLAEVVGFFNRITSSLTSFFHIGSSTSTHSKQTPVTDTVQAGDKSSTIGLNKGETNAYYESGIKWMTQGDYDKALVDFNKAVESEPNNAYAYAQMGIIWHFRTADNRYMYDKAPATYDNAIVNYTKAIDLGLKDMAGDSLYNYRGSMWEQKGNYDNAISDYTLAIAYGSNKAHAYANRGTAWQEKKIYDKALSDFEKAVALDPNTGLYKSELDYVKSLIK